MSNSFDSLKKIFYESPELNNFRRVMNNSDVVLEFHKIFPELKKIANAAKVEKKTLYLRVSNAAMRNELKLKESSLLDKINKYYNEERVDSLKFSNK